MGILSRNSSLTCASTAVFGATRGWWRRPAGLRRGDLDERARGLLEHVWEHGWAIIEGFLDPTNCAALCAEWDRVAAAQPSAVQVAADGADHRLFGIERASRLVAERFSSAPALQTLSDAWYGGSAPPLATLGARLVARDGNRGSGQGWHRDSFFRQFKAIVYLTDVGPGQGPFQYVTGSHRMARAIGDTRRGALGYRQNRIPDEAVARIVADEPERLRTFVAPAGTAILADTRGVHRGQPIAHGVRYALTNYYYPLRRHADQGLRGHFEPYVAAV